MRHFDRHLDEGFSLGTQHGLRRAFGGDGYDCVIRRRAVCYDCVIRRRIAGYRPQADTPAKTAAVAVRA